MRWNVQIGRAWRSTRSYHAIPGIMHCTQAQLCFLLTNAPGHSRAYHHRLSAHPRRCRWPSSVRRRGRRSPPLPVSCARRRAHHRHRRLLARHVVIITAPSAVAGVAVVTVVHDSLTSRRHISSWWKASRPCVAQQSEPQRAENACAVCGLMSVLPASAEPSTAKRLSSRR